MSFSYSGGVITQTGTDANPLGMAGLTGVTITGTSEYRVVQLDGVKLIVNGTLTLPKYYRLYFINTSTVDFKINGTLNVDYFTTNTFGTIYHTTPWVEFGRQSTSSSGQQCLEVANGGTLNWRGGSILADPVIRLSSGSTILFNNSVVDSTQTNMFRIYTTNLTFDGPLINIGKRTTINASGITLNNYSPRGGSGVDHGASNTDFVLNNFSPEFNTRDSILRYDNGDSIFNASTGMNLLVAPLLAAGTHPQNGGGCRLYRKISTNIKDINNNPLQGVKTFLPSYNDGNRVNLTSNFGSGWDFTAISDTTLTTGTNGKSSIHNQILKVWYLLTTDGNDSEVIRFDKDADDGGIFTASSCKYEYLIQSNDYNLNGLNDLELTLILLPDANITESSKATVDAYTEINTSEKFYDRAKAELFDAYAGETQTTVTRSGSQLDARSLDVVIDATAAQTFNLTGSTLTIKTSNYVGDMITTGTITLLNGAIFTGTRTDTNGTIIPPQPVSITNIVAGSRLQIYNVTTNTEVVNQIVSGTSYSATYVEGTDYTDGDTVRVRLTYVSGTTAKAEYTANVLDTSNGWSLLADQQDDDVYNTLAIDGSNVANFAADYANDQVDVAVAANFNLSDFYAWWVYNMTTAQGIREFFGGITALDQANFRINTSTLSLFLDNTTSTNLVQLDNRRIFRTDGVYPVLASTSGGGGIDVVWRNTILIAETATTGLTPEESAKLTSIATDSSLIPGIASKTSLILVK